MLLDHLGYFLAGRYPFLSFLRIIGRLAFPLYVFLLVNGYRHTHNKLVYALRLLVFAVISQLPFCLVFHKPAFSGNVFFTLLLSLLCLWSADVLLQRKFRFLAFIPTVIVCGLFHFGIIRSDYGMKGILLALVFFFLDGRKVLTVLCAFFSLFAPTFIGYGYQVLNLLRGRSYVFVLPNAWTLKEIYALLVLVLIFFYHGKRGYTPQSRLASKALQFGFYAFYPVHLLILYFIFRR